MEICEDLLKVESVVLEHGEITRSFDSFSLSEKLLAIDDGDVLTSAAPIALRLCRETTLIRDSISSPGSGEGIAIQERAGELTNIYRLAGTRRIS